ncbi:hypothetical protein [Lactiplantibacillus plajomi]|uniref:Integral membrane protein n=1 Tax=Lactiplantibacillus plajomi TaxID=1457217 RepID=A0ABV6K4Q0_9LACO|nr:hypothetical protein [Lactiplantibacillus plajomi]
MKQTLTDYGLALPGYLISLYLVSPLRGISWWLWVGYLSVSALVSPWWLRRRPALAVIRGMDDYEPPYVKQLTDPEKQAPRMPITAPASLAAVIREVGGFGLLRVLLKRWGIAVIALPGLLLALIKDATNQRHH